MQPSDLASVSEHFPATYGEVMLPFCLSKMPNELQRLYADDPMFREWLDLADRVSRAEKISSWTTWTEQESAAYAAGDLVTFSRLRGYTENEIAEHQRCLQLISQLSERYNDDQFCMDANYCLSMAVSTPALQAIDRELERMAKEHRAKE